MGVTDDQLKALGRITMEFSFMETLVASVIWKLLEDTAAMALTAHLPFSRLCQAAVAIAKEKMKTAPKVVEQLESIMGRAMHLEDERNRLIHSWWTAYPGDASGLLSRIKITARGRLDIQFEPKVPPDDLNRVASEMEETTVALGLFMKQNGLVPEPTAKAPYAN